MAFFCNYRYKLLLYILSTSKIAIQFSPNKMYIYDETIVSGKGRGVWFFSFFFFFPPISANCLGLFLIS